VWFPTFYYFQQPRSCALVPTGRFVGTRSKWTKWHSVALQHRPTAADLCLPRPRASVTGKAECGFSPKCAWRLLKRYKYYICRTALCHRMAVYKHHRSPHVTTWVTWPCDTWGPSQGPTTTTHRCSEGWGLRLLIDGGVPIYETDQLYTSLGHLRRAEPSNLLSISVINDVAVAIEDSLDKLCHADSKFIYWLRN